MVCEVKSGENKTVVLLEIREKLWFLDQQRKRELGIYQKKLEQVQYIYTSFIVLSIIINHDGFRYFCTLAHVGTSDVAARKDYSAASIETYIASNSLEDFDLDWPM